MREDRSWFAVDSKSFEISMDVFGEKLKGIIVEISKVKAYCRVSLLRGLLKVGRMELLSLGVLTRDEPRGVLDFSRTESKVGAFEENAKNSYVDAIGRVSHVGSKLVCFGQLGKIALDLKGGVKFAILGGPFLLIEFENKAKVDKVLLRRFRCFKESFLHLESREVFKKIWECCGGFVVVDEDTVAFKELQWTRLLVKSKGVSEMTPVIKSGMRKEQGVRNDGGGGSRADCIVEQDEVTSGMVHSDWEKVSNVGPVAQGFRNLGRPTPESLKDLALVERPTVEVLNGVRACGGLRDAHFGRPDMDVFGIQMGSSPLLPNLTKIIDEALMEEASRHTDHPFGEADLGPLRVILANEMETEVSGLSGKANGVVEEVIEDVSERVFSRGCGGEGRTGLGVERFLEWGAASGIVVFWDNMVLELVDLENEVFSISYHFKNCFFHKMVNDHRRRNNVDIIRINGVWILEENEIKERIVNVFMSLLSNSGDWRPPLFGLQCETLENMDAYALEVSFMEEKVFGVLLGCSEDKVLGLDGFSMAF
ncbi:hypothetical protein CK203_030281 [Vitis vinifera]|uniref:DUF4283 domain-containing protein n=1 Tax=Vitis vinifera TaxID=29760 RepID=A0A438IV92_VITVI|nr:hypothetical protein CK203_030281 [Vitis vinifera]